MPEGGSLAAAAQALSIVMRQAICLYDLAERELRLANWLILETYDQGQFKGQVDFHEWARVLGFWDAKSVRPKQCMEVFIELQNLGLLDWNEAEGTYELRPYQSHWTGLKRRGLLSEAKRNQGLSLRAERPLSEALSEVSRENALASGPDPVHPPLQGRSRDWPALYRKLREGLTDQEHLARLLNEFADGENSEPQELPAENAGEGYRRKTPVSIPVKNAGVQHPENVGIAQLPAKNAGPPIASLALSTKAKLAVPPAKNAGEPAKTEAAWRYLQSVDARGTLQGRFGREYEGLCERSPDYVLCRLKGAFEEHLRYYQQKLGPEYLVRDPVGWMGRKAAEAGHMQWHGRRS